MSHNSTARSLGSHLVLPETARPSVAKANLQKVEIDWKQAVGRAIARAVASAGLTDKEAAARLRVDPSQFGKWLNGGERPQFDRLFAVPELRRPLIKSLAQLDPGAHIVEEIRFDQAACE